MGTNTGTDAGQRQGMARRVTMARLKLLHDPRAADVMKDFIEGLSELVPHIVLIRYLKRRLVLGPSDIWTNELLFHLSGNLKSCSAENFLTLLRRCIVIVPDAYEHAIFGVIRLRNFGQDALALRLAAWAAVLNPDEATPHEQRWKIESGWGYGGRGSLASFHISDKLDESDRFYRTSDALFFPRRMSDFNDLREVLRRDIFRNYIPTEPPIRSDRSVAAFGSCFAQHVRQWLIKSGRLAEHLPIPEGLNNTFAIRQFVSWLEGRDDLVFSYEKDDDGKMRRWDADKNRDQFRASLSQSSAFVITIGVAEVWRDKATGGVFWRGVPADQFDPDRHEHRLSTVSENAENLIEIAAVLRRLAGDVPIVYTLSPVPLIATMRQNTSIFAADAVSKSTLRLAIEEVVTAETPGVRYWPSFEAFRWLGAHLDRTLYDGENNPRHPNTDMIGAMIELFVSNYFSDAAPGDSDADANGPVAP